MSEYRIYIKLPPYLEQWLNHSFWNPASARIEFPRGSAERSVLELFLTRQDGSTEDRSGIPVEVPTFYGKNPDSHCRLPKHAMRALVSTIKKRFRKQMWDELHRFSPGEIKITDMIYAFLEANGIETTESNFLAVRQAYMRMRKVYENSSKK